MRFGYTFRLVGRGYNDILSPPRGPCERRRRRRRDTRQTEYQIRLAPRKQININDTGQ